ncbi:6-phosphofructokinase [Piscicoccus intestinalis]|uniref:6-phosphofructokinase n=1 Tax=Piscicoccus intestinalis TaxID=746033 RepID=UPI000A02A38E|nr:6-phosphofructokinase [Piscicoccus intestinalis]
MQTSRSQSQTASTTARSAAHGADSVTAGQPDPDAVRIGVLTSGGDAQGMNAVVRAVVRSGIHLRARVYAIYEGYQGAVDGGDGIRELGWDDVGSILHRGGTIIGTARCAAFREREGRLAAAKNLLEHGIDRLVVIGGDGSLTGTDTFRREWPGLLAELHERGDITEETVRAHPTLMVAGVVGSIDNDLVGTDMTVGTDSALHRILEAIDAISSTAASHQRTFVVEVMGRHCGYLPLSAAIAGGADAVFVPENPPAPGWEDSLCQRLSAARAAGRRDSIVLVAEGARDQQGNRIDADLVRDVLAERLGEDARVTILGHVQRGGTPSAYDRWMSTLLGYAAVQDVLGADAESPAHIIGVRHNRLARLPLVESIANTRAVAGYIEAQEYDKAIAARGESFTRALGLFEQLTTPVLEPAPGARRVAFMHCGGLAPGMNSAASAAVKLALAAGLEPVGVRGGFPGLRDGAITELGWADVEGWLGDGGAELGTRRRLPEPEELYGVARTIEANGIDALVIMGGFNAYRGAHQLLSERNRYPAFNIPIMCVPTSIDNNLPGSELSIGADTALNDAVWALDRIKQSGSASTRCFVAEVMGRRCGYLAFMAALASGAERVYLNEVGIRLGSLVEDIDEMTHAFVGGRRLYLVIRNEQASEHYTTDVLARLFEEEGGDAFDVREAYIGHLQQGGNPTPFDRLLACRLMSYAIDQLGEQLAGGRHDATFVGLVEGRMSTGKLAHLEEVADLVHRRPYDQWWMPLLPIIDALASPTGSSRSGEPRLLPQE